MTFIEILKCGATDLPVIQQGNDFRKTLKERLDVFGELVDSSNDLIDEINGVPFKEKIFKTGLKILRQGILETIDDYYKGKPSQAYQRLRKALDESHLRQYLDKGYVLQSGTNFFRIRVKNENYALRPEDLFHIPFEKRGIVKTQRYSIPGLPSLYISNSTYVAWEELGRPGFDSIQAVRLVATREIRLLDLTTDVYMRNAHLIDNNAYGWQPLYKVITWPLVAACSFKVLNREDTFKPEYIIPQLLMQWINTNDIDGIVYSSTHLNPRLGAGNFHNYVIPVRSANRECGLCPILTDMFHSTDVLPMQLGQFATPHGRFYDQETISTDVNSNVEWIELIKGTRQPYHTTSFGLLEHSLCHLKPNPIVQDVAIK